MTKEETMQVAIQALDWARGSWGQGKYDKPRYDDVTMAGIYTQIAILACDEAQKHHDKADNNSTQN